MANKYIPANKKELQDYRRDKAIRERNRKSIIESSYITIRRTFLEKKKENPNLENLSKKLNQEMRKEKHNTTMDIFRYYFSAFSN
jgi:hypothetical protein